MARLADYKILTDGHFTLESGEERTFNVTMESSYEYETSRSRPFLMFKVQPSGQPGIPHYTGVFSVDVNDKEILNNHAVHIPKFEISHGLANSWVTVWEVFSGRTLKAGATNTIQFRISNSSRKIRFSDVVLFYQRDLDI